MAMTDEDVITRRLIFDGEGTGDDRRINLLLKLIVKWVKVDEDPEKDNQTYDKIVNMLNLCEFTKRRSELTEKTDVKQMQQYGELFNELEKKVEVKRTEIAALRCNLKNAQIIKQNRIRCNLLTKAIHKETPRKITIKKLAQLQMEMKNYVREKNRLQLNLQMLSKQMSLLNSATQSLDLLLSKM